MSAAQRRRAHEIMGYRWPVTCQCGRKYDFWNGGTCLSCLSRFVKAWGIK